MIERTAFQGMQKFFLTLKSFFQKEEEEPAVTGYGIQNINIKSLQF